MPRNVPRPTRNVSRLPVRRIVTDTVFPAHTSTSFNRSSTVLTGLPSIARIRSAVEASAYRRRNGPICSTRT